MALTPKINAEMVAATARKRGADPGRPGMDAITFFNMDLWVLAWLCHHATQVCLSAYITSQFKSTALCARTTGRIRLVFA